MLLGVLSLGVRVFPWVSDTVMVAVAGLLGAIIAQAVNAWMHREDRELAALRATVEVLSARVSNLEASLEKAERKAEEEAAESREYERLLWHVASYLRDVLSWARMLAPLVPGDVRPTEPPVPDTIKPYL